MSEYKVIIVRSQCVIVKTNANCICMYTPAPFSRKKGGAPFEFSLLKGESWYFGTHKKRCSTFPNIHTIIISDLFCKQKVCNTVVLIFKFMMDMSSAFLLYSIINTFLMIYRSTFCTYLWYVYPLAWKIAWKLLASFLFCYSFILQ